MEKTLTGYKDKNGKEIALGDFLINETDKNHKFEVIRCNNGFEAITVVDLDPFFGTPRTFSYLLYDNNPKLEILNI